MTAFYALALGLSWAGWIPFAAAQAGILPFRVPVEIPIVAQFGPSVAALLLTIRAGGLAGLRQFCARSCRWRVGFRWYAIALLLTPATALAWQIVHRALGQDVPGWSDLRSIHRSYVDAFGSAGPYALDKALQPSAGPIAFLQGLIARSPIWALVNFIVFAILTGPVSEEFGWRGYALPRLQADRTALRAAVIVGLLWGGWHTGADFWRLLFEGNMLAFLYPIAITMGTIPLAVLLAWLFNETGGSLLPGMLLHASFNSTAYILSLVWTSRPSVVIGAELVVGLWIAAIVVVAANGAATLARRQRTVTDVHIRTAQTADLEALGDVFRRSSLANDGDRTALLANPDVLALSATSVHEERTRAAVINGAIVGFVTVLRVGDAFELEDLFVDPRWMRQGIGLALVRDAAATARAQGVSRIEVTANPHALAFYERAGFVPDGTAVTQFGPAPRLRLDVARTAGARTDG